VRRRGLSALAGVADQALNAGLGFLTVLVAGRLLDPAALGGMLLAMAVALVALGVARAFIGDVLLVHAAPADDTVRRRSVGDACRASLALGLLGSVVGLAVWATGVDLLTDLVWLVPFVPALLLQDAGRYAFLAARRADRALVLDGVRAAVQVALLVAVVAADRVSAASLLVCWGAGAAAGAVLFLAAARVNPLRGDIRRWLRETSHLSRWFAPAAVIAQAQTQLVLFLVAGLLSKAALGGLRGMQILLLMPVQNVLLAVLVLLVPRYARVAAGGSAAGVRRWTRRLAPASALLAASLLLVVPWQDELVQLVLPRLTAYAPLLLPVAVQAAAYTVQVPFTAALRGMQRGRSLFVHQVAFTLVTVPLVVAGALTYGEMGAAWGLAAGAAGGLAVMLVLYRRAVSELDAGPLA